MRRTTRIAVIALVACLVLALAGWWAYLQLSSRITSGPMVQMVTPSGFTVVWRTNGPGQGRLLVTDRGRQVANVIAAEDGPQFVAAVTGLQPGRSYEYRITLKKHLTERALGGTWTCKTDAGPTASFRMLAFGDSGTGKRTQYLLAEQMVKQHPDLIVHTGDLVYPDGAAEAYPTHFFEPYAKMISYAPFMPVLGNHDCKTDRGQPLLETFVLPQNGPTGTDPEHHYWFDYGCARFAAIDTDVDEPELRGQVAPWLRTSLASAAGRWRFACFHHPPYSGAKHEPDARVQRLLAPVLEQAGVDIVFNGHNHLYERTRPIRAGQVVGDGEGVIYIVTGAGGANRYAEKRPEERPRYIEAFFDADFSFTVVDVAPKSLKLRQIDLRGRVVDHMELSRGPRASLKAATSRATATALSAGK